MCVAFLQITDTAREVGQRRLSLRGASHSAKARKLPPGFIRGAQGYGIKQSTFKNVPLLRVSLSEGYMLELFLHLNIGSIFWFLKAPVPVLFLSTSSLFPLFSLPFLLTPSLGVLLPSL